jgi:hypothetical protein
MSSRTTILALAALAMLMAGSGDAWAQRTSDSSVTVTANNRGIFSCTLSAASFDFGDVDADGTDYSTANVTALGRNGSNDGGQYENTSGSVTFTCRSAPSSTVGVALISTGADHTVGTMDDDGLEIRIPAVGGGTSTGYQVFTSTANLITGMTVGNGGNSVNGDVDMRLNVLDADDTGANTWVVRLRATGNP